MLLRPTLSNPIQSSSGWDSSNHIGGPVPPSRCCYQLWQLHGLPGKSRGWDQWCFTSQTSLSSAESKNPAYLAASLFFRNELSRLGSWEQAAGFFPKSSVTKQLAVALREEICSAATGQVAMTQSLSEHLWHPEWPGRNADSTPKAAPFQSASSPGNPTGITIRYCNSIS